MLYLPQKLTGWLITIVAVSMSVFHLYVAFFGAPDAYVMRGMHLAFALALAFLILPGRDGKAKSPNLFDLALLVAAAAASLYPMFNLEYIRMRMYYVDDPTALDYVFGITLILVVMEAARRATGLALTVTAALFLLYGLTWGNQSVGIMLDQLYLTTEGIFGIPLYVSATYVMLFILFGAFVERSGAGQLFMDFALALAGHTSGGPAKVAVITSSLFGTVSGSAVANVMTTGTFTIPLMRRTGYRPAFAGAVEAVASTGGQLMPPIMGAAAFVMAEFLGTSYLTVAAFAILPAILYYVAVFMAVHFEAKRIGLKGIPKPDLPRLGKVLRERGHLFLPLFIIVGVLLSGYSAAYAALCGIGSVIPTTWLRSTTRYTFTPRAIIEALEAGARNTLVVALACACAGIVIGTITLTGLGLAFTNVVMAASQNLLLPALILTMLAGIVLGMGLPTTPAYIVQVALLVPALVRLGVEVEAAHLFVLYFAVLSAITPPVAMAVYAANGISRAGLMESSWAAVKLGLTGYIIPFMFVFGPSLLMIGEWQVILGTVITATIGVTCLAAALHNYFFFGHTHFWERLLLLAAAFVLINPGLYTDIAGASLVGLTVASQLLLARPKRGEAEIPFIDAPETQPVAPATRERQPGE
ncbi:MAG: TRAP transporter, 4TM/12TM fusion protein [Saliniramus fredricksonii]|uniref:TRAP transporter, 4TM/12TM fusion protein n=1 Tax=Saliniramus fredricksonii TaxID=1653334 RepID=A0A0P7X6I5_9HYPH|nr:TRAP transporter permease [Saliniramus fredricksonii]KPQ10612.1 MAG: TRAP transporter, 4TM/12TM fusion protein [Saliniramus fredricksonii]SCC79310.1 TRAP transporter, 4TM/12TM fusion protein [Saliniramus fredricksonii]